MLFNSTLFLQFFAAFLLLYYLVRNHLSARNLLILAASYVFYGAWDFRFLGLLLFSSLLDYSVARALKRLADPRRRKTLISLSIAFNLGLLGFFKYFDFFAGSLADLMTLFGVQAQPHTLGILLPVGISFYTFQTMSYTIDVYRRQIEPEENLVKFLAYVSFFPQLVAGPIERAGHLLPQFGRTLQVSLPAIREGIWLGIWGMFKKVVIADNLAPLVEMAYGHPKPGAPMVILGTIAFALQIYGDFSGYSDIARGLAKILGFELMLNFNRPYFATNLREFWQRWHISLSTWLRDYVYIPLGGNRRGSRRTLINLFLTLLLGGFWHGAKWTFIAWGAWHGCGLIFHRLRNPTNEPARPAALGWLATMIFVLFGWLLFRADSLHDVVRLLRELGSWTIPSWFPTYCYSLALFAAPLFLLEVTPLGAAFESARAGNSSSSLLCGWKSGLLQSALLLAILLFWGSAKSPFIYFQF